MSDGVNECSFIGNLGKDPEVRMVGDKQTASWSLGVSESWGRGDERKERTEWVNCVAWGPLAGVVQQYAKKGSQLWVRGKLQTRSWDDKDGVKKYRTEIIVERLKLLGSRDSNGRQEATEAAPLDQLPF